VTQAKRYRTLLLPMLVVLAACAADRLHSDGLKAVDQGSYEQGLLQLQEAVKKDPHNMEYRLDLETRRDAVVQRLLTQADAARNVLDLDGARQFYRRVLVVSPGNNRALLGLQALEADARYSQVIGAARKDLERKDYEAAEAKVRGVLSEDPGYGPAKDLSAAIAVARGPVTVAPRLKTKDNRRVTLQLRDAPTKMVFEVLSRQTGINFILDKDVKSDGKTTIFVQDVPVEEAIDLVLNQNSLARQILASNMVLIYPNNATKQKEYEEEIVRTFYLTNAGPKDVESMLKTVLGTKTLYVDERASVVVMRDTPDAVRMAEKLVASIDVPEAEVMLEIEVLEVSSSKIQDLGITYPGDATLGVTQQGMGIGGAAGNLVLSDLRKQGSRTVTVSPLGVTLSALKQAGVVNTLASPRIRARNNEKAKILIGSRLPVITNSVTPTAGGTAVVTGSVQYLDVGLTLEVQPVIHQDSDVAIKLNLEVSSLLKQVTTSSGTIAYQIGTRDASTLLRLKDGETQILAGLISDSDTRNATKIPGLGDIPILGKLFGLNHTDVEKDEIVLSVTPRIVRMQPRAASDNTEFWYGTETRTRSAPYPADSAPVSAPAGMLTPAAQAPVDLSNLGVAAASVGSAGAMPDTTGAPVMAEAPHVPPIATPPAALPAQAPPGSQPAATRPALSLEGPSQVHVGDDFQVTVHFSSAQAVTRLRAQLRFDSAALQMISATTGGLVPAAAGSPTVESRPGGAQLEIVATPEDPVRGDGDLMLLRFKALRPRPMASVAAMLSVLGGAGAATGNSSAAPLSIAIQQ